MIGVSLFSGIGGMDVAAEFAGFDIAVQVEINDYCKSKLKQKFPDALHLADVRGVGRRNLPARPDIVFGGFPCQPFSFAGLRKGTDDNRDMWPEFARIIGEIRPRSILLENVPAICYPIRDESGRVIQPAYGLSVVGDLAKMGYDAQWGIVSAADAGAAHIRDRWWCVAYPNGYRRQIEKHQKSSHHQKQNNQASEQGRNDVTRKIARRDTIRNAEGWGWEYGNVPAVREKATFANRATNEDGRHAGPVFESEMGFASDGFPDWLVKHRRVAPPFVRPYEWEPRRTIRKDERQRIFRQTIRAIGNAVFVPTAFALFWGIAQNLKGSS